MDELKSNIRKELLEKRLALTEKEVREKSLLIKERLFRLREFKEAELIMFYVSFRNEVRTQEMIEEAIRLKKRLALPVTSGEDIKPYLIKNLKEDLVCGCFGIPEPKVNVDREVDAKEIALIIVPGIAFDRKGYRIGFGRGFYDRFLRSILPPATSGARRNPVLPLAEGGRRPFCAGLAFEIQIVESIPAKEYDEKVDAVITEKRIYAGL